jgi:adenylate cyclase
MTSDPMQRKLRAIFSADVKGYSRLMGDDEEYTVKTITKYRNIIADLIKKYRGRVVDAPGDNILAEFGSALDAVNSAISIQDTLATENRKLIEHRQMDFRIGINLADVLHKGDRIYGDGVNLAARIENLAEPGGICVSRGVYDQVKKNVSKEFKYMGEHIVKNISEPVRIYRILLSPGSDKNTIKKPIIKSNRIMSPYALIFAILVVASAAAIYKFYVSTPTTVSKSEKAEAPTLRNKPSIAVLPFVNMSKDPDQEYFSDGVTNDIIAALSKFRELLVIASNTVFTYKGKAVNIERIGQELNVKYILEGSVQRIANKLRINAQLIDATTGFHIWSEHYNRDLEDIFSVQNEIVNSIVGKFGVEIDTVERKRAMQKETESLKAYDYWLRGMEYLRRRARSDNVKARNMFEKAVELDPQFSSAYVGLAHTYEVQVAFGWTEFPNQALRKAEELSLKALGFDNSNAYAYRLLGLVYAIQRNYDLSINKLNRAIELNPNDARSLSQRGQVLIWAGKIDDAINSLETTYRYDPNMIPGDFMFLGIGYYLKGNYEKAISILKEGVSRKPDWVGNHIILAATYAQIGHLEEAKKEAHNVLQLEPFFKIDHYGTVFQNSEHQTQIVNGLLKAGFK